MKKCWDPMVVVLVVTAVLMSGCNSKDDTPVSDQEKLQGTWVGAELGQEGEATLVFSDDTIHFTGARPQEWYKGTAVLNEETAPKEADFTITECPAQQYVGTLAKAIYKLEGDTLTLAGAEPGEGTRPSSFDASGGTRVFQFTLKPSSQD